MHRWIGPLVLAGLLSGAAPAAAERLTPAAAAEIALRHHPLLRAAEQAVRASAADRERAASGLLPRVNVTWDWARSTNPVFVFGSKLGQERFGPADFAIDALNRPDALSSSGARVVVQQSVWDAGRTRLHRRAAGSGVDAAELEAARARQSIAFGAVRAFWDAVHAWDALRVARAAEEAAAAGARMATEQVDAGMAVPSDRMQAEVRLAEVRALRIRAEHGARVADAALRVALGVDDARSFELVPERTSGAGVEVPIERLVGDALARRPDLLALDARLAQARTGEAVARSYRRPEIGMGAQLESVSDRPLGHDGDNWTVGASVRIPVFDGFETRARTSRAVADRQALEAQREALVAGIRLEVLSAWADALSAAERARTAESALASSEEALRIVQERYREGMATIVELLGAEAARTAAQGARAAAARDVEVAGAALSLAVGAGGAER